MFFYKDKSGQSWFIGIYSNNFEDRENEILTWDSHLEYAKWVKQAGVKLPVTIAHQPQYPVEVHLAQFIGLANGTFSAEEFSDNYMKMYAPFAFAQSEAVIPINGFVLVLAKILKGKESTVKLLSKSGWGMSHGFLTLGRDENTLDQYRSFEFTSLPMSLAANQITLSSIQEIKDKMHEVKGFSEEDREILQKVLNAADTDEIEEATRAAQEVLQKVMNSKDINTEDVEVEEVETETAAPYEEIREKIFNDLGVEGLQNAFKQVAETLQNIEERIGDFEQRIKQTELSEDEKVANQFYMPNWDMWNKSTDNDETPDVEKLKEGAMAEGKAIDGVDAKVSSDNPLQFGMWDLFGRQQ